MKARDFIIKQRAIWNPRSLQLLRERAAARYALQAVPRMVDGIAINFPETEASLGLRVVVKSRRIQGRNLLDMIYDSQTQDLALDMALVALKALSAANIVDQPFAWFGRAYVPTRRLKVTLGERFQGAVLSPEQKARLHSLVSSYHRPQKDPVLVHGDLHAGNLVVNCAEKSLGFTDLEMMHAGNPATNFAQLWISFHFADPLLGRKFYQRYASQSAQTLDEHFNADVRAEVALRCYALLRTARKIGHAEMEYKARILLDQALEGKSDENFVLD